jgi:hypothetical protein
MKKFAFVPMVALAFAACADNPMEPSMSNAATFEMTYTSTVWQAGNGSAFHGYNAPTLSYDGDLQCAAWSDNRVFENYSPDHYSYEFLRWDGDGWVEEAKVNNADRTAVCVSEALPAGSYRLVGMAKDGKGQETTTHHTHAREFVIGGTGYAFAAVGGNCSTGTAPNANASTWNLTIQLYFDGALVTDGRNVFASGDLMNYSSANHEYHINAKDSAGGGPVVWSFAVGEGEVFSSFTCTAPAPKGGQGGGRR